MNPGWCCCEDSRLRTFPRRCADVLGWIIPGVIHGDVAQMPDVSGGIHSDLDWRRDFTLSCDTSARDTSRSECRIGFIYGSEEHQPPDSQIWPVKNNRGNTLC